MTEPRANELETTLIWVVGPLMICVERPFLVGSLIRIGGIDNRGRRCRRGRNGTWFTLIDLDLNYLTEERRVVQVMSPHGTFAVPRSDVDSQGRQPHQHWDLVLDKPLELFYDPGEPITLLRAPVTIPRRVGLRPGVQESSP